jgi:hypothetical protein
MERKNKKLSDELADIDAQGIKREGIRKVSTYRRSGLQHDQMLLYKKPGKYVQGNLFDALASETVKKIQSDGITEDSIIIEGIKLTDTEHRLIDCINKLLHTKSINSGNPGEPKTFYSGNEKMAVVHYGKNEGGERLSAITPMLSFKPTELYQTYMGERKYSGKDVEHIKTIFLALARKNFLIKYTRKITGKKGGLVKQMIEEYSPLFKILKYTEQLGQKTAAGELYGEKKEEILIQLNPIFKDQIETKYIEFPTDIIQRTIIAAGSHNISESTNLLRDVLMRDLSGKHYEMSYNYETLIYQLKLEKYLKESRKKLIGRRIDEAIKTVEALGLVLKTDRTTGADAQLKFVFHLNQDFLVDK